MKNKELVKQLKTIQKYTIEYLKELKGVDQISYVYESGRLQVIEQLLDELGEN